MAQAKQLAARRDAVLPSWELLIRPASADQIAIFATKTIGSFPNLAKANADYLMEALIEEVAAEQPSIYMLVQGLRAVRRNYEFLSIRAVV